MPHFTLTPIAMILLVAACQPVPDPGRPGGNSLARCGGDPVGALMGQPVSAMPASGGWMALRVIEPGMVMFAHMILMDSESETAMCLGRTYLVTPEGAEPLNCPDTGLMIR